MTVNGVLVLDKPSGLTSHDVVARVRRKLGTRKVGHAGTLDPDVTGVLVVCVGDATRLLEYIQATVKTYVGEVTFGVSTDTDDASGRVLERVAVPHLTEHDVMAAVTHFHGEISQRVPAFSAVHIDGKRAYDLAREGIRFELPERLVSVMKMDVWDFVSGDYPTAQFSVTCSKGTYVRSICRDWGGMWLGIPSHMSKLKRTQSGAFTVKEAVSLAEFEASDEPHKYMLPLDTAVRELPRIVIHKRMILKFINGQEVPSEESFSADVDVLAVYSESSDFIGIAHVRSSPNGRTLKPKKIFLRRGE